MILQDSIFLLILLSSITSSKLKPDETIKKKESSIFTLNKSFEKEKIERF